MAYRKINGTYQPKHDLNLRRQMDEYPEGSRALFLSDGHFKNYAEASALYIADADMDEKIKKAAFDNTGKLTALINERKTGKTMRLQHCFQMLAGVPRIDGESCIAFFSFKDYDAQANEELLARQYLGTISSQLEKQFSKISNHMHSEEIQSDLYSFIEKVQPELLECENERLVNVSSPKQRQNFRLQAACRHMPLDYEIRKLQYILTLPVCPINKLIFCIDDLDGLDDGVRNRLTVAFLKMYFLLHVFPADTTQYYTINMLISMTPDHYIKLKQEPYVSEHPFDYEQIITSDLNLEKYFSRKLKYCISREEIKDLGSWKRFQQLFAKTSQRFNKKYDKMIKNLCFYDVSTSMQLYARILCNNYWVMQGKKTAERPWFCFEDYTLNNITVIRALACGENQMYINHPDSVIPNILYNTRKDKKYSILSLYLLCYFSRLEETSNIVRSVSADQVVQIFSDIFSAIDNIVDAVAEVIQYHLKKKLLKRDFHNPSHIYISTRGLELWNMLQSDSVLLELCREDCYREYESEGCKNNPYCSDLLMKSNQQAEIFMDLFRMIDELAKIEKEFVSAAEKKQMTSMLQEILGEKRICSYLLSGVEKSMEYSGLNRFETVRNEYSKTVRYLELL